MHPSELKRVKAVFAEAVEMSGAERQAFLDQACADDGALRKEVDAYLAASERAGDALSSPGAAQLQADVIAESAEGAGGTIGHYKLLQLIGEGGFGSVFMAEQERPVRRRVALKIIKLGMDTKQVIARFEAERQALAMMDHPNIARVLEAGATASGRPYFVMELVRGIPITEYCDVNRLTTSQRLELFVAVCHAIQHAHQKGVIHRDIKPSNVLVTLHDGTPVPKVIDFGIAKATNSRLTEKTLFTEFSQMIGTPAYVSPEQAEMSGLDIDTRSDIYSLGVLLYELLTGTTPFDPETLRSKAYAEVQRIIREVDPPRPSTRLSTVGQPLAKLAASRNIEPGRLRQLMRGDLDWIVMKALEKDRTRRYATANEFARDILRHLNDEAIEACPPSTIYRIRRFVRRNRVAVFTIAAFAALAAAAIAIYIGAIRIEQHKTASALVDAQQQRIEADRRRNEAQQATLRARESEADANRELVRAAIAQGRGAAESTRSGRRFDSLELLAAAARISPTADVRSQAIACMGLADMRIIREWEGSDDVVCFNHACTTYADCNAAGDVLIRAVPTAAGQAPVLIGRLPGRVIKKRVAFSPDDQLVAAACDDDHVRVFKLDGRPVLDIADVSIFDFAPDGLTIAVRKPNGPVIIHDIHTGEERRRFQWPHSNAIAFSPDGRKLAMWDNPNEETDVVVVEFATQFLARLSHPGRVLRVGWNPGGNVLATACESPDGKGIYLWNLSTNPARIEKILAGQQNVFDVKFSHDGELLAAPSSDGTTRLWDVVSGEQLVKVFCSGTIHFSRDDRILAFCGDHGRHVLAEVATARERRILAAPQGYSERPVAFSPDGVLMACAGDGGVRFWNVSAAGFPAPPIDLPMPAPARAIVFHPDGASALVTSSDDLWRVPIVSRWSPALEPDATPAQHLEIGPKERLLPEEIHANGAIQISGDGLRLALAEEKQDALVVDLRRPSEPLTLSGSGRAVFISISADGKWVATGTWKGTGDQRATVWDAHTGKLARTLPVPRDANVAFSPDNHWLVTGSSAEFRFWEVGTWQARNAFPLDAERVGHIVFSSDSQTVALSTRRSGVRLIDTNTMAELATLEDDGDERPLGFSPGGALLATMGREGTIRLWDLRRIREQLKKMGLDWPGPALPPQAAPHRIDAIIMSPKPAI